MSCTEVSKGGTSGMVFSKDDGVVFEMDNLKIMEYEPRLKQQSLIDGRTCPPVEHQPLIQGHM